MLKTAPNGTPYLAFIDDDGTASLYQYAYLGMEDNVPQYAWIGGKAHPDASVSLDIGANGQVTLAYTDDTTVRVVEYDDPRGGPQAWPDGIPAGTA